VQVMVVMVQWLSEVVVLVVTWWLVSAD